MAVLSDDPLAVVTVPTCDPVPKNPNVSDLQIVVVRPPRDGKEAEPRALQVGPVAEVSELMTTVLETLRRDELNVTSVDLTLYFQNASGPRAERLHLLEDGHPLKIQGVRDGAKVVCQLAHWDLPICKQAESPYYMWAQNEQTVPQSIRVQKGGCPVAIDTSEAPSPQGEKRVQIASKYSWVDDSRQCVKVYISAQDEPGALASVGKGAPDDYRVEFNSSGFIFETEEADVLHRFEVRSLEHDIEPELCNVKIAPGKRITISLRKAKDDVLWNTLCRWR